VTSLLTLVLASSKGLLAIACSLSLANGVKNVKNPSPKGEGFLIIYKFFYF